MVNLAYTHFIGITAEMCFGESFWQYAACTREEVIASDWLETEERENGVLYVKAYHQEFDEAEGEQLVIQRRLLKLLYNIDEHNPCGTAELPPREEKVFTQSAFVTENSVHIGELKEKH